MFFALTKSVQTSPSPPAIVAMNEPLCHTSKMVTRWRDGVWAGTKSVFLVSLFQTSTTSLLPTHQTLREEQ